MADQVLFQLSVEESGAVSVNEAADGFRVVGGPLDGQAFGDVRALRTALVDSGLLDPRSPDFATVYSTGAWSEDEVIDLIAPAVGASSAEVEIDGRTTEIKG